MTTYVAPEFFKKAFHCPYCSTFSRMTWNTILEDQNIDTTAFPQYEELTYTSRNVYRCKADCCSKSSYWLGYRGAYQCEEEVSNNQGLMIWPKTSTAEHAHEDMPEYIKKDYEEARQVSEVSPRAAVALLRLALQKLLKELGGTTGKIDSDIGELVAKNILSKKLEKMSDILRIAGNNSVHPDKIGLNLDDNPELVDMLFRLINTIIEEAITAPRALDDLYDLIPQNLKKGIEARNQRAIENVTQTKHSE